MSRRRFHFRLWMLLLAVDFRICRRCQGCLDGRPNAGECPRCGTPYTHDALRAGWQAHIPKYIADPRAFARDSGLILGERPGKPIREPRFLLTVSQWEGVAVLSAALTLVHPARFIGLNFLWNLAMFPGLAGLVWLGNLARDRAARGVIAAGFRRCPECEFDLRGLDSPGVCPECRTGFSDRYLAAWWRLNLRIPAELGHPPEGRSS